MDVVNFISHILDSQAAVHSLLQAVQEIAARGEGRDRDAHVLVQRRSVIYVYLIVKIQFMLP